MLLSAVYTSMLVVQVGPALIRFFDDTISSVLLWMLLLLCLFLARHVLALLHYMRYADDGIGFPGLPLVADVLEHAATVLLTTLMLVLSKGWSVTRSNLKRKTKLLQFVTTIMLLSLFALLFVLELTNRDPAATYHPYETSTARVIIILRLVLLLWFTWCVRRTLTQETRDEVRAFYRGFAPVGGWWLLSLPVYSIAVFALPPVNQLFVISVAVMGTNAATLAVVSSLTFPRHIAPVEVVDANRARSGVIAPAPHPQAGSPTSRPGSARGAGVQPSQTPRGDGDGGASMQGSGDSGRVQQGPLGPPPPEAATGSSAPSRSKRIHAPARTSLSEMS